MNIDKVKQEFPIFDEKIHNNVLLPDPFGPIIA